MAYATHLSGSVEFNARESSELTQSVPTSVSLVLLSFSSEAGLWYLDLAFEVTDDNPGRVKYSMLHSSRTVKRVSQCDVATEQCSLVDDVSSLMVDPGRRVLPLRPLYSVQEAGGNIYAKSRC